MLSWFALTLPPTVQEYDPIRILEYGTRYYWPDFGRFISPDTIAPNPGDPQDLNRYSYTQNNPLRYTDPTGHEHDPTDGWLGLPGGGGGHDWGIRGFLAGLALKVQQSGQRAIDWGHRFLQRSPEITHSTWQEPEDVFGGALIDVAGTTLKLARQLKAVSAASDEGKGIVRQLAALATHSGSAKPGTALLGHSRPPTGYQNYILKAQEIGANYFALADDTWSALDDPWLVNKRFLDDAIARGG